MLIPSLAAGPRCHACLHPHTRAPLRPRPQDLQYGEPGVLGHAATWPQAAAALPQPDGLAEFDWEGDRPLGLAMEDLVIYEMHVRGFTQDASSGVSAPGGARGGTKAATRLGRGCSAARCRRPGTACGGCAWQPCSGLRRVPPPWPPPPRNIPRHGGAPRLPAGPGRQRH
jgi:hypothetical protein